MGDDGWEVATKSGRRRKGGAANGTHSHSSEPTSLRCRLIRRRLAPAGHASPPVPLAPTQPTEKSIARAVEAVEDARRDIAGHEFYERLTAALAAATLATHEATEEVPLARCIAEMVVYGLGSLDQMGAVHIRYQLALACLLCGRLPGLGGPPLAFDPVFGPLDRAVLPKLGLHVMDTNEEGRRPAPRPTFFFMPHCEAELTDALLEANEAAGTLRHVVILGNSFEKYRERWGLGGGAAARRPATLLRLLEEGRVREVAIPECRFPVTAAFNDMSLHTFT